MSIDDLKMARISRTYPRPVEADASSAFEREFNALSLADSVRGKRVGITAGSRGINGITDILRTAARLVRESGGVPVFLAAMGSHGGGTKAGQREILNSLCITSDLGADVITCDKCRSIGTTATGLEAYMLESAFSVDAIIVVNRVKIHTAFHGDVESGLHKMMVVGLGGPRGAAQFHSRGSSELPKLLLDVGALILSKMPIIAGFAIVENAYEETASINGVTPGLFPQAEQELLDRSRSLMPSLPVDRLDGLIIEEMGKNYSGTGIDTNIIGRLRIEGVPEPELPAIEKIAVLALSEESHGNANGIGLADITTKALAESIDRKATYLNCATTGFMIRGATPAYMDTERESLELMMKSLGEKASGPVRIIQIPNTLHLTDIFVSGPVLDQIRDMEGVTVTEPPAPMEFDQAGRLVRRIGRH